MSIERALKNYLNCVGPKVKDKDLFPIICEDNNNALISTLFVLANEEIDDMDDSKALDRVVEVLKLMENILRNGEGVNRKIVSKKILKLYEKLDRNIGEGRRKYKNIRKVQSEFNKVRRELDVLIELNEEKDNKPFEFVSYLMNEVKNLPYLEYTFSKMPALANVKDKDEVSLFRHLIRNYLSSVSESNDEDIYYYNNLIKLILSQKSFQLSVPDKKGCLEEIYKYVDQLSYNKKNGRKNRDKINEVSNVVNLIKGFDDVKEGIHQIASKYNIHVSFDENQIKNAKLVHIPKEGVMTDRKPVSDYLVSIDGDDAVEIDDCLSCKKLSNGNYLLGVHIASVLGYFPYDSDMVQEAISRAHSIYLSRVYQTKDHDFKRTIPIFPYDFSADKGSLKEGENRFARTYYFEINPKGEVVYETFLKSIIKNNKRLSYQDANDILENGSSNTKLQDTLYNLKEVASLLEQKYKGTELYNRVKECNEDVSELRVKKIGSENIVYQCMLLTGNRVAKFFADNNYPCLYRVHEVNEENNQKLQAMIDSLNTTYGGDSFKNLYQLIDGLYPKGWYDVKGRHYGLDLDHYCHCTSVLRRAADIVVEHALEVCYDKEPTEEELIELKEEIDKKAKEINAKQSPIEYFVKEYQKKYRR